MIRHIVADKHLVFIGDWSTTLDCSVLLSDSVVFIGEDETGMWAEKKPFTGRLYAYNFSQALNLFSEAQYIKDNPPPAPEPEPELYILSTDTWTIPADNATPATITYTTNDPAKFTINGEVYVLDPEDGSVIFEIVADNPGPIEIKVRDKQIVITAEAT